MNVYDFVELWMSEAHEGERYRDRLNTFYNRLYKRADKVLAKKNPCNVQKDEQGNVTCAGCAQKDELNYARNTKPNTLCCRGCEHHGPEGCKASMPLACRTWLCPTAYWNDKETGRKLDRLSRHAARAGIYGVRASKRQMMAARFGEALDLVYALLEADIQLRSPADWDTFTRPRPGHRLGHGTNEFLKHVAKEDQPAFCDAMRKLRTVAVMVPDDSKWCLKMPSNYGIYGKGDQGMSVLGKTETRVAESQPIDNPTMSERENRQWRAGL